MLEQPPRILMNMKPQGHVLHNFMWCRKRGSLIVGPLGSGKTWQVCQKIMTLMTEQAHNPNGQRLSRVVAIRNTYLDLMGTTVKEWQEKFSEVSRFVGGGAQPPTSYVNFALPDGTEVVAEIQYLSMDREDDVKKLRGMQVTWAWLNEMKELPKSAVDMADLRVGRYPSSAEGGATHFGLIGDSNSPDTDHWMYELMENPPDTWGVHRQPGGLIRAGIEAGRVVWRPNPRAENLHNLLQTQATVKKPLQVRREVGMRYYLDGMKNKDDDWIAVNLANEYGFVKQGKPVYGDYSDAVHCQPIEYNPSLPLYIGVDFGLTPAAAFAQQSPTGQVRWIDELVTDDQGVGMGAGRFGELLSEKVRRDYPGADVRGFCDPAGDSRSQATEDTARDILNTNSKIYFAATNTNDPTLRLEAVKRPMKRLIDGQPGMLIDPKCGILRKGFMGGYCYKRIQVSGDAKYKEVPDKNRYSHIHDAAQYASLGMGQGSEAIRNTAFAAHIQRGRVAYNVHKVGRR